MRHVLRTSMALLFVLLAATACGSARNTLGGNQTRATLRVENQNYLDMRIYVLDGAQRVRLGTVPGLTTRTLSIPGRVVFGVSSLSFQADPIGGNAAPITEEISVSEGDEIYLRIPA